MAVLAPMASASVTTATAVNIGALRSRRTASLKSCSMREVYGLMPRLPGRCFRAKASTVQGGIPCRGNPLGRRRPGGSARACQTSYNGRSHKRGRPRFDGSTVSQDACRGPSTSTKDGNQPNCGFAARSRSLRTCERLPSSAYGWGADVILVGWLSPAASDGDGEIFRGWCPAVFPLLHAGRDTSEADTHRRFLRGCIFGPGCNSRRLHHSTRERSERSRGSLRSCLRARSWQASRREHMIRRVEGHPVSRSSSHLSLHPGMRTC